MWPKGRSARGRSRPRSSARQHVLEDHPPRGRLVGRRELAVGGGRMARQPTEVGHEDPGKLLGQHFGLGHLRTDLEAVCVKHLAQPGHLGGHHALLELRAV
eukprot:11108623-Alexandrium_andersonii.AAC.1